MKRDIINVIDGILDELEKEEMSADTSLPEFIKNMNAIRNRLYYTPPEIIEDRWRELYNLIIYKFPTYNVLDSFNVAISKLIRNDQLDIVVELGKT